jgi:hypothetical protein
MSIQFPGESNEYRRARGPALPTVEHLDLTPEGEGSFFPSLNYRE